jgi:hypothetical protein
MCSTGEVPPMTAMAVAILYPKAGRRKAAPPKSILAD